MAGPIEALKARGLTVVCLVAPTRDPADGRAVVATSCETMAQAVDALDQCLKKIREALGQDQPLDEKSARFVRFMERAKVLEVVEDYLELHDCRRSDDRRYDVIISGIRS